MNERKKIEHQTEIARRLKERLKGSETVMPTFLSRP